MTGPTKTADAAALPMALHAKALLIRAVERRLLSLFSEGRLFGTVHTCIGQEWTGIAVAEALQDGDLIFSNHRCHGHYLARTDDVDGLIAEIMGRETGICGGRGGSQHLCAHGFFSNGVQGGISPVSAGLALAQKLRGTDNIAACFIGDGTLGEGVLYEAMNIASKWDLPLFILIENNLYAQSTSQLQTLAGDICARAEAFGIATDHAHTWDAADLLRKTGAAAAKVRAEHRPFFMRVDTYRLMAHSKGDDDRDEVEVKGYWDRDPVAMFERQYPEDAARMNEEIAARIERAVETAEAAPYSKAIEVDENVPPFSEPKWIKTEFESGDRVVNRIHEGLREALANDERVCIIGEDIEGPYGGAFKVTKNLSQEYPGRVRNTPISEAAIVGVGNGLALAGMRPVCELMFGDFMALAADQIINHAAKFHYMYNGQVNVPAIVRTPMGGKRGYGATHSQSIEKHFLGVPGTRMLAIHHRFDPKDVYARLFESNDRPTLVIENKLLYGARVASEAPEGFVLEHTADETFPTTRIRPEGAPDVTILCYGGMLTDVEQAVERLFDEHEIVCEVICPLQLYPFNPWPLASSLYRSGRLISVEEGQGFAAFAAEAIAQLDESAPGLIQRVRRVSPPRHAIPSCGPLEKELLPGVQHVIDAVRDTMAHG